MTDDLDKYITTNSLTKVNELSEYGYRVHTVISSTDRDGVNFLRYLLSLSSAKYEGITDIRDVKTGEAQLLLDSPDNWEILETYSKFIRMVLRE